MLRKHGHALKKFDLDVNSKSGSMCVASLAIRYKIERFAVESIKRVIAHSASYSALR